MININAVQATDIIRLSANVNDVMLRDDIARSFIDHPGIDLAELQSSIGPDPDELADFPPTFSPDQLIYHFGNPHNPAHCIVCAVLDDTPYERTVVND